MRRKHQFSRIRKAASIGTALASLMMMVTFGLAAPASAGYDIDHWSPWEAAGNNPTGAVRYDGSCSEVSCSFLTRLEVYQNGKWRNWTRTDTSRSPVGVKRWTASPGSYCPSWHDGSSGQGRTMTYRTENYLIATSRVEHTTSVDVGAEGSIKVVDVPRKRFRHLRHRGLPNSLDFVRCPTAESRLLRLRGVIDSE